MQNIFNKKSYFFLGINFGRTTIQEIYGKGDIINYGISVSNQKWPHLLKLSCQRNSEFTFLFGESKSSIGFISSITEYNLLYNYLYQIPFIKKLFTSIGTGVGIIDLTRNVAYTSSSEESAKKDSFIRLGIPFEIRLGFLHPSKKIEARTYL